LKEKDHLKNVGVDGRIIFKIYLNPLNAKLNPTCHLLELLGAQHILHVSGVRVKGTGGVGRA